MSQTWPATGWNESTNPSACHCEVTVRHLESVQNRRRKLHVDALPYVKMPEPLPGVSTNRPDGFCRLRGVCRTDRVKAIRHAGKSCERFVAPRCLLGLLRLPITCSPLSTTLWCLLLADTVHYCKHMPRRGGMYVFIYVERMWDAKLHRDHFLFLSSFQQHIHFIGGAFEAFT